jgi:hypothetical protein
MIFSSVVLPQPDGAGDGHRLAGLDAQADVAQHLGLAVGVAEAHVHQLDAGRRVGARRGGAAAVVGLGRRQHDVGQPLALQAQHAQRHPLSIRPLTRNANCSL